MVRHLRPHQLLASELVYSAVALQPARPRPVAVAVALGQPLHQKVAQALDFSGIPQRQVREILAVAVVCLVLRRLQLAQVLELACSELTLPLALSLPPDLDFLGDHPQLVEEKTIVVELFFVRRRLLRVVLPDLGCLVVDR